MVLLTEFLYMDQITALTLAQRQVTAQQAWLFSSMQIKMMQEHRTILLYWLSYYGLISFFNLICGQLYDVISIEWSCDLLITLDC